MNTKVTPKDFFLWIGAMVALYTSVFSLLALLFEYVDYAFPDTLNNYSYGDPYSSGIRFALASLVVVFPVFLLLMRLIRRDIIAHPAKADLWIRRWALYLTLFIAAITIIIDLIVLVNTFLGGELTTHFVLKTALVFLVAGGALMHFLADIWGYWVKYPQKAMMVGWGVGILIVLSIASGFFIIGNPADVRLYRFDDQKVSDLQNIQSMVLNYWQVQHTLPTNLKESLDPLNSYQTIPLDPQSSQSYSYEIVKPLVFKLCAHFNKENKSNNSPNMQTAPYPAGSMQDNWQHGAGDTCFTRTIDPKRYPKDSNTPSPKPVNMM